MTGVYGFEPENISKKCSVRIGIPAVDNHMSTKNHFLSSSRRLGFLDGCPTLELSSGEAVRFE
jgi:hypothetical protein